MWNVIILKSKLSYNVSWRHNNDHPKLTDESMTSTKGKQELDCENVVKLKTIHLILVYYIGYIPFFGELSPFLVGIASNY